MAIANGTYHDNIEEDLSKRLSTGASVHKVDGTTNLTQRPRWSEFEAPEPRYVVSVATEEDVAKTVQYCTKNNLKFLAQNGASAWAATFDLDSNGVLIDLSQLNQFTLSADKTEATIGGGARVKQTIEAAAAAGVAVVSGNCECVGTLGAMLGGGYGYLSGLYGMVADNVISMRVVLPDGELHTVSQQSDPNLFWAMKGAGPNFGIVTSATVRAYALRGNVATAWTGPVIFSPDQLEEVVQVINDLLLEPQMNIFMYFLSSGPPSNAPVVITQPFLLGGTVETGHQKFAKLFDLKPVVDNTMIIPYSQFAAGSAPFCVPGGRKPAYGAGFDRLDPVTWRKVWNLYTDFQRKPGAEGSYVILERYPLNGIQSFSGSSASFPHRHVKYHGMALGWYSDPELDDAAQEFGSQVRDAWRRTDGYAEHATYINFAHGDEELGVIYGGSLPKLREVKKRVDSDNVFDQWFNIR